MIVRPYHMIIRPNLRSGCDGGTAGLGARSPIASESVTKLAQSLVCTRASWSRTCAVALTRLAHLRFHWLRNAHIGAGHTSYLGDGVVRQINRRMCLADGFLVRAGHETERLAFLQVHVRGMTEHAELMCSFLERRELIEELLFGELLGWEATFALVVGVDEVLHVDDSFLSWYSVYTLLRMA